MFPISKNGYTFSFEEAGLQIKTPGSRELHFPFSEKIKVNYSAWKSALELKGPDGHCSLAALSSEEQKVLLLELFRRWKNQNHEAAKKSAFDYIDGQKGFVALAFGTSLVFCLPLALGLMSDSRGQFTCTTVLKENSVVGSMDVTKFKRKRKGHYILDLSFTAPNGKVILGRDQLIIEDEAQIPKAVPVVYSPENPDCWSLTTDLKGSEVNWAKRRFFGYFTGMFGAFFLVTGIFGIAWSAARWIKPRPHKKEIAELFSL